MIAQPSQTTKQVPIWRAQPVQSPVVRVLEVLAPPLPGAERSSARTRGHTHSRNVGTAAVAPT